MKTFITLFILLIAIGCTNRGIAQKPLPVKIIKQANENKISVYVGNTLFTNFLYPDTLEKPVLYPVFAANGTKVVRSFPLDPKPTDPIDHPHHIGIWFNYEKVNGLDFWNNSYAIPKERKHLYGWIKTDKILSTTNGTTGKFTYHATWNNQKDEKILDETTTYEFSGTEHQRMIDRVTVLKANTRAVFDDVKDGLIAYRLPHELQIPTVVKGVKDTIATGNYLSSEGIVGDSVWGTRGKWCMAYGKMGKDTISISIIDHPKNPFYPAYWHARGYGLFAANSFGQKPFDNTKPEKKFVLEKGEQVTFRFRILIENNKRSTPVDELNKIAAQFAKKE